MPAVKQKVLLVEDDPFMATLLSQELAKEGFEVLLATNGEEALKNFKDSKPDALVLDILLPRRTGLEVLRDIRGLDGGADVPVVVLSNLEEASYIRDAEELGVKAYLIKANVQLAEIVAKVKEALKR
ncbi:MAG: response regulator [Patescibacteria group bacterium]